jgi:AraC-like DNA-binding protein
MNLSNIMQRCEATGTKVKFSNRTDCLDPVLKYPDEICKTWRQGIDINPGLKLVTENFRPHKNISIGFEVEVEHPLVGFGFIVSGDSTFTVSQGQSRKKFIHSKSGLSTLGFVQKSIDPLLLDTFMEGDFNRLPHDFRAILDGSQKKHYLKHEKMTPSMHIAARQIISCPYQGFIRQIYLESKVMELISLKLSQMTSLEKGFDNLPVTQACDIERIRKAREILTCKMDNPPSLLELAKSVELTHTRLSRGFRELYGTTVFDYLRRQRLEKGRLLLEQDNMNIAEVAYTIGFSSPSHFARDFLRYYGTQPKLYKREMSRRPECSRL